MMQRMLPTHLLSMRPDEKAACGFEIKFYRCVYRLPRCLLTEVRARARAQRLRWESSGTARTVVARFIDADNTKRSILTRFPADASDLGLTPSC